MEICIQQNKARTKEPRSSIKEKKSDLKFPDQITEPEQSHHPSSSPRNKTKTNVNNINEKHRKNQIKKLTI